MGADVSDSNIISTGNPELDQILGGGLTARRVYLVEGHPGTGKTTLGMQFLMEGARKGQCGLYVSLSETRSEILAVAESHGWSLEGVDIYELVDPSESLQPESQYTMFQPSEVELAETTSALLKHVDQLDPRRVVLDSLSELRLLAQSALRHRRQLLALKHYFANRDCTVLFLDDKTSPDNDMQLQSIAHGVISLEHRAMDFGDHQRRACVVKMRGREFVSGWHDFRIERGGLRFFPRLQNLVEENSQHDQQALLSGNASLDALLGDGIPRGTSTLMLGPAGVGKSTCATLYVDAACQRGERAVMFVFDETRKTLLKRSASLGMNLKQHVDAGLLQIHRINPGDTSPGHFAHLVREATAPRKDGRGVSVVVIDSLNGYFSAMPEERFLQVQMHELLNYTAELGVATFVVVAQHGMLGTAMQTPVDTSYLADTVMLFRYFESGGEIRQAISVVKKRSGEHERTIREFRIAKGTIAVGEPLRAFQGVLAGTPTYTGDSHDLINKTGTHDVS